MRDTMIAAMEKVARRNTTWNYRENGTEDKIRNDSFLDGMAMALEIMGYRVTSENGAWDIEDGDAPRTLPTADKIVEKGRYTVSYKGYMVDGDREGRDDWNEHDYDNWNDVQALIALYGDLTIYVKDNVTGNEFAMGGWEF